MCGICGIADPQFDGAKEIVSNMLYRIRHRGPDDAGIFVHASSAVLGHVRLSIQDLSESGHQPMLDPEERFALVYNGEIYNSPSVREELKSYGFIFRGHSDTEVLLYAYMKWQEKCLDKLKGMFAFAIWDTEKKELFAARDRFGIKPFYYWSDGKQLAFASEIKALLEIPGVSAGIDHAPLIQYLIFRYNSTDTTVFKGIDKLLPGHFLRWKNGGELKIERYWDLKIPSSPERKSEKDWIAETQERLEKSVQEHLLSDVPIGVFLSGGIDSNTVMSLASKASDKPLDSFSVGFSTEKGKDEIEKINDSVNFFGSTHHELILAPDIEDILPKVIYAGDELNADPACVPTYLLSEMAAEHVKVVLSGEGADELFGGYERSLLMMYGSKYLSLAPKFLRSMGVSALKATPNAVLDCFFKYSSKLGSKGFKRLGDFADNVDNPGLSFLMSSAVCDENEIREMLTEKVEKSLEFNSMIGSINSSYFTGANRSNFLNHELRFELESRLWADLLMKLDNSSMPFSLEGRVPYLDHDLAEFAMTMPPEVKIKFFKEKSILRKSIKKYLPDSIVKRKKDHFFVPIDKWMGDQLKPFMESFLSDDFIRKQGIFDVRYTSNVYSKYKAGSLVYARQLWNILCFQIWYQIYVENKFGFLDSIKDNDMKIKVAEKQ